MASPLETLRNEVAETRAGFESLKVLLAGLSDRLRGAASMRDVREIAAELDHLQDEMAAAVEANPLPEEDEEEEAEPKPTPEPPTPTPEPDPVPTA